MISVVINYCTIDERFIRVCINEALKISNDIIIPVSDHLYDGTRENIESIRKLMHEYKDKSVRIVMYDWHISKPPRYWHNYSRYIGRLFSKAENKYILFIDSDEIVDADLFKQFLLSNNLEKYITYKFDCYWYFRDPTYRARTIENSQVMIHKDYFKINLDNPHAEREQFFEHLQIDNNTKLNHVRVNNVPMFHHYSWVRTKEQMLSKVRAWGHKNDKDWVGLIEQEFSREFNGTDFVHNYSYDIVANRFNL